MVDIRDWIASHARRSPQALAQIDHATGRRFTYQEMNTRVDHIAGYFRDVANLEVGDVVAVLGNNSSETFDIDFACGRAGVIFLPLNTRLAAPEIAFQLADAKAKLLFVGNGFEDLAAAAVENSGLAIHTLGFAGNTAGQTLDDIIKVAPLFSADGHSNPNGRGQRQAEDGWTLIYSSGTTGRPKGVLHTHAGVTMQAIGNSVPLGLGPKSCGLTVLPLFHISGLNVFAHAMFYAGATQVTMDRFDPMTMITLLSDKDIGVTHFCAVPTIFEVLASLPAFATSDFSTVEGAFVGGAPSTEALLKIYAAKGFPLIQGYGLTETGPTLTVLDADDAIEKLGSAGKPIMHVDVRVIGADGKDVEAGQVGEIIARGPSVITQYFNRPEAQASSFIDGWLRTGDMGSFDEDGFLFIKDRKKDMYISGGENVYPAEIESCLSTLDGVAQVAVIGIPDPKWGETGAACIVKKADSSLTEEDVLAFCQGQLARYKHPKKIIFMDALPLGGSGKVLKNALRDAIEARHA